MPWEKETIPDNDLLYYRIHKNWMIDGELRPGVFRNREGGMSTDWSEYSTPEETLQRATSKVEDNVVIQMEVGKVRKIPNQIIEHTPQDDNRAHTEIFGEKDEEARVQFIRISQWIIRLGN